MIVATFLVGMLTGAFVIVIAACVAVRGYVDGKIERLGK